MMRGLDKSKNRKQNNEKTNQNNPKTTTNQNHLEYSIKRNSAIFTIYLLYVPDES